MQRVLMKRVLRDLKTNLLRYLALAVLIIISMYLVISVVGAAETAITETARYAERTKVEDGEFATFVPLSEEELARIEAQGIELEKEFYLDYKLADDTTLRVFALRKSMNLIEIVEGDTPKIGEVAMERRHYEDQNMQIGDTILIGGETYRIAAVAVSPDYEAPYKDLSDTGVDSVTFGTVYMNPEDYETLKMKQNSSKAEEYHYAYRFNPQTVRQTLLASSGWTVTNETGSNGIVSDGTGSENTKQSAETLSEEEVLRAQIALKDLLKEMKLSPDDIQDETFREYYEEQDGTDPMSVFMAKLTGHGEDMKITNLTSFLPASDNARIGATTDDVLINRYAGLAAGVIIIVLIAYVISVFVVHSIEQEAPIIGTLYAMGVTRRHLIRHYVTLPVIVTWLGSAAGTAIGFSRWAIDLQLMDSFAYFSLPEMHIVYPVYLLIYGLVIPPVVAVIVNVLVINRKLSVPALRLIKNEQKQGSVSQVKLNKLGFATRFQIRQMLRERRTAVTVIFGMFVSLFIIMLSLDCYVMCKNISIQNKRDTRYEYMYVYKYPERKAPEGGTEAYITGLKRERFGYNLDVTIVGTTEENPYFDLPVMSGQNSIVASSAFLQKFGVKVGDTVVLSDELEDRDYVFTITGETEYSPSLYVFMNIEDMRKLFGEDEDYYNAVFSDQPLTIPVERLYSVTSKADIEASADIFISMMNGMIVTLIAVSTVIFIVVMYLMMKVMIDRAAFHISLVKIFGYRNREVKKLYLNGNFYVILFGSLICIPFAKWAMDNVYPLLVSNVGCAMDLKFPWYLYGILFGGILILYVIINNILIRRIDQCTPAEVLKNRE